MLRNMGGKILGYNTIILTKRESGSVGKMRMIWVEGPGFDPGPNTFLCFVSPLQILCITIPSVYHVPSTSSHGIHHQSNPTPPPARDYGTPSRGSTTGSNVNWALASWARIFSTTHPQNYSSTQAQFNAFFISFLYVICLITYFYKLIIFLINHKNK